MDIVKLLPIIVVLLIILLFVLLYTNINILEHYNEYDLGEYDLDNYYLSQSTQFPFWNTQIGTTRNMSYDLRGDIPIPRYNVGPWLNSSTTPIYNKPLYLVS